MVLHVDRPGADAPGDAPVLIGFVVAKSVGNAVIRNRVKRRLRHLIRPRLSSLPAGARVVVRALPAAATQPERLTDDLTRAWTKTLAWVTV